MKRVTRLCVVACLALLVVVPGTAYADDADWRWPLRPPRVVQAFQPPDDPWGPGHRGIDLAGSAGDAVHAMAAGTVTFAESLAGRGVVVVKHGALRSTYEPVRASVHVGQHVAAGAVLGTLEGAQSHCAPQACLHVGVLRGQTYLDPLSYLPEVHIRLKPLHGHAGDADDAPARHRSPPAMRTAVESDPGPAMTVRAAVGGVAGLAVAVGVGVAATRRSRQ